MPHFWFETNEGDWAIQTLNRESCLNLAESGHFRLAAPVSEIAAQAIRILPADNLAISPSWVLLANRSIPLRINGEPLWTGVRTLRDKDEIRSGSQRCFFSSEELARVVPFPGLAQPAFCPRCKQRINAGDLSVCCPNCRAWHHESDGLGCWRYSTTCALCLQQCTDLDAGYSWTPDSI